VFPGFSEMELPVLARLLRRTVLSALAVGAGAILVALLWAPPLAAVGIALGLGVAIINLRFMDAGVAKIETKGETDKKVLRRLLGTRTATRLLIITGIAIGLVVLDAPLGIGMVVGLVIFQILFVINVGRAVAAGGGLP
jgi:hypothetical protein